MTLPLGVTFDAFTDFGFWTSVGILAGTYVLQNSSRSGITNQLDYMDLHGLPPTYASTYVKQVYAVTPQLVSDMAKKHLQDERALIVIVGDRKVIEEQVKSFGEIVDK